jgi:hypothetical protein
MSALRAQHQGQVDSVQPGGKDVGRAAVGTRAVLIRGPNDAGVAADGHGGAEAVFVLGVGGGQLRPYGANTSSEPCLGRKVHPSYNRALRAHSPTGKSKQKNTA